MLLKVFFFTSLLWLAACGTGAIKWDPDDYTVRSGDTLYSIAWRYELDPTEFARWNRLDSPYIIRPGDRLHTNEADSIKAAKHARIQSTHPSTRIEKSRRTDIITVGAGDTLYKLAKRYQMSATDLAEINGLSKPYTIHPGDKLRLKRQYRTATSVGTSAPSKSPSKSKSTRPVILSDEDTNREVKWRWPVKGKLIKRFNKRRTDSKGIDIANRAGTAVNAAAPGKVVYSGDGLTHYGNLIIIKHSQSYLSAYAHNRKLLVKEGQIVKVGQIIAELGSTGTEKPKLHFEIRKRGKPVDPLRYLPSS